MMTQTEKCKNNLIINSRHLLIIIYLLGSSTEMIISDSDKQRSAKECFPNSSFQSKPSKTAATFRLSFCRGRKLSNLFFHDIIKLLHHDSNETPTENRSLYLNVRYSTSRLETEIYVDNFAKLFLIARVYKKYFNESIPPPQEPKQYRES